jgi:hypothetical protein
MSVINASHIVYRLSDRNPRRRMVMRCKALDTMLFMCCSKDRYLWYSQVNVKVLVRDSKAVNAR